MVFDEDRGVYYIPSTYFLPPTNFTTEEALAVMVVCYEFGSDRKLPFYEAAHRAALKFQSSLPDPVREYLRDSTAAVQINLQRR